MKNIKQMSTIFHINVKQKFLKIYITLKKKKKKRRGVCVCKRENVCERQREKIQKMRQLVFDMCTCSECKKKREIFSPSSSSST